MTRIYEKQIPRYFMGAADGDYGMVALDIGQQSVTVMADTSFGSFCHHWSTTGCNPVEFLGRLKFEYTMRKFRGDAFMVFDRPAQEKELRRLVLKKRRARTLDKDIARWSFDEVEHVCDAYSLDQFYSLLCHSDLNDHLASELDDFEAKKTPDPLCVGFWAAIWVPLMRHLAANKAQAPESAEAVA